MPYLLKRKADGYYLRPNRGGRGSQEFMTKHGGKGNWTDDINEAAVMTEVGARRAGDGMCWISKASNWQLEKHPFDSLYEIVRVALKVVN